MSQIDIRKSLEYAYPTSILGGKSGKWRVELYDIAKRKSIIVYVSIDRKSAEEFFNALPFEKHAYSL